MAAALSELEEAIETLVVNYDKYASKGFWLSRKKRGISKDGFQKMLNQELRHMLTDTKDEQAVSQLRQTCGINHDGPISFKEYWVVMGTIANSVLFTKGKAE